MQRDARKRNATQRSCSTALSADDRPSRYRTRSSGEASRRALLWGFQPRRLPLRSPRQSIHACPRTRAAMPKARDPIAVNPAASSPAPVNFRSPHLEVPLLRALDCIVNSRDVSVSISRHAHRFQQQQIFVVCVTRCTDAMSTRRVCVLLCATNLPQSHAVVAIDASLRTTRRRTNARSWGSMRHRLHQSLELPVPTI